MTLNRACKDNNPSTALTVIVPSPYIRSWAHKHYDHMTSPASALNIADTFIPDIKVHI